MSDAKDLWKAAVYAYKTEKNKERALALATKIVDGFPDDEVAESAKILISRIRSDQEKAAAAPQADARGEVYSKDEWDKAKPSPSYSYSSKYNVARGMASLFEILGWLAVAGGILLGVQIAKTGHGQGATALLAAGAIVLVGLFQIMIAQLVRAMVDNADHTGEMLAIMKSRH